MLMERVKQGDRTFSTRELNQWLEQVQRRRQVPSSRLGRQPRLYYMTQTGRKPPELTLFVNAPQHLNDNYRRFLALRFAEDFSLRGAPLRFKFRKSE
jgi:GTPase